MSSEGTLTELQGEATRSFEGTRSPRHAGVEGYAVVELRRRAHSPMGATGITDAVQQGCGLNQLQRGKALNVYPCFFLSNPAVLI